MSNSIPQKENKKSKMFPFITQTWNPIGGECKQNCSYCWAKKLIKKYGMQKYIGEARLFTSELAKVFKHDDFVFACDMTDLFGSWVPREIIQRVLDRMLTSQATFLLLTKNPSRYLEFDLPKNCVAGATIESDCDHLVSLGAPKVIDRLYAMRQLKHPHKMISIEPIMRFSEKFFDYLMMCNPEFVAVGYDNYNNGLDEPQLSEAEGLIALFELNKVKVYRKTLREKLL